jgi:hypothetical protein
MKDSSLKVNVSGDARLPFMESAGAPRGHHVMHRARGYSSFSTQLCGGPLDFFFVNSS